MNQGKDDKNGTSAANAAVATASVALGYATLESVLKGMLKPGRETIQKSLEPEEKQATASEVVKGEAYDAQAQGQVQLQGQMLVQVQLQLQVQTQAQGQLQIQVQAQVRVQGNTTKQMQMQAQAQVQVQRNPDITASLPQHAATAASSPIKQEEQKQQ